MKQWVCEDVGLVINELRDKFSEKLNQLEGEEISPENEQLIKGVHLAYDILDEVADDWTSERKMNDRQDRTL